MEDLLRASLGPIEFSDLRAHLSRGAVIVLSPALDLLEVGRALGRDDKEQVGAWIEAGLLSKPTLEQIEAWSKRAPSQLTSVVVQPFVLVRDDAVAIVAS